MKSLTQFCCPRCHGALEAVEDHRIRCLNIACAYHTNAGFPIADGKPVLVDFDNSVVSRDGIVASAGKSVISRERSALFHFVRRFVRGESPITDENAILVAEEMLALARSTGGQVSKPVMLVVGGGTVRSGIRRIYARSDIDIISFDVYASDLTDLVADGHQIPLPDASVHGVWIEAVLEHVLDPAIVVAEIHRVLKPEGIIYAETPFMQQVHEGAYDFTRFTHSGHRWLFRRFAEIASGPTTGPGTALIWSIRYFFQSLTSSRRVALAVTLPLFWLRFFDLLTPATGAIDAASGYYFLGRRQAHSISPDEIIAYYRGAQ